MRQPPKNNSFEGLECPRRPLKLIIREDEGMKTLCCKSRTWMAPFKKGGGWPYPVGFWQETYICGDFLSRGANFLVHCPWGCTTCNGGYRIAWEGWTSITLTLVAGLVSNTGVIDSSSGSQFNLPSLQLTAEPPASMQYKENAPDNATSERNSLWGQCSLMERGVLEVGAMGSMPFATGAL